MKVEKIGLEKRVFNRIYVLVSYKYNKNIFLWWRDSMPNVYAYIGILNLCFLYIVYESNKTRITYFVLVHIVFIHVCVWPRESLPPTYIHLSNNICLPICNRLCHRRTSSLILEDNINSHRLQCVEWDCMDRWLASQKSWIWCYVQVRQDHHKYH